MSEKTTNADSGAWKSIRQKERFFDKETGKEFVKRNGTLCLLFS